MQGLSEGSLRLYRHQKRWLVARVALRGHNSWDMEVWNWVRVQRLCFLRTICSTLRLVSRGHGHDQDQRRCH